VIASSISLPILISRRLVSIAFPFGSSKHKIFPVHRQSPNIRKYSIYKWKFDIQRNPMRFFFDRNNFKYRGRLNIRLLSHQSSSLPSSNQSETSGNYQPIATAITAKINIGILCDDAVTSNLALALVSQ